MAIDEKVLAFIDTLRDSGLQVSLAESIDAFEALKVGPHGTGSAALSQDTRAYVASLPPRQWNDFLDWREDYVAEYYGIQADAIRRDLPGAEIMLDVENLDGHVPLLRRPEFSWNGEKLARGARETG